MSACDAVHELLVAHALGALEASEAALVRDHLAACEPCRAADAEARADVALIEAPPVVPPPLAWTRIRARVAASRAGDEPVRGLPDPSDSQALIALSCSFCRGALVRAGSVYCASCLAPHHPECWREYGRCSVMGCGEQRVVRPSERPEVAPAPVAVPSLDKAERLDELERRRRRRRRWAGGGGLVLALTGGLAAAALTPSARLDAPLAVDRPRQPQATPAPAPTPAPEPRWDVGVRDASLGELCAALEREAGARIDLGASLTDLLVREGRWRARTWRELLREVAREHDLVVREGDDRLGLGVGAGSGPTERATATLERRTTQLLELAPRWRLSELRSGPPHEVAVAPAGRAIALLEGKSVRLLTPGRDATLTFEAPVSRAVWSDDGSRIALVLGGETLAVVDTTDGPPTLVQRDFVGPGGHVAWTPGATSPVVTNGAGQVSAPLLNDDAPAVPRLIEPLGRGAFLELIHVPFGVSRLTRLQTLSSERRAWSLELTSERLGLDLSLDRSRVLVVGADARLLSTSTGEALAAPIPRRSERFRADLSPDGACVAWIDDGALFVRTYDDGCVRELDTTVVLQGAGGAVVGCAWRGDGQTLALWTADGAVGVITKDALAGGLAEATLQLPNPGQRAIVRSVAFAGDALVIHASEQPSRQPRIVVAPAGTHRPDLVVDIDWATPDGAPPRLDVLGETPPPAPAPAPAPTPPASTEPAPPPAATETAIPAPPPLEEPAPAPIPAALAHVRPGQRYTFRGHQGEVRTWEVLEVTAEGVVYREAVTLNGAKIGDPRRETWALRRPEQVVRAVEPRRARREIGGAALDCLVFQVGDTTRWVAVTSGGWLAFPGEVRYERGGTVMLELIAVE